MSVQDSLKLFKNALDAHKMQYAMDKSAVFESVTKAILDEITKKLAKPGLTAKLNLDSILIESFRVKVPQLENKSVYDAVTDYSLTEFVLFFKNSTGLCIEYSSSYGNSYSDTGYFHIKIPKEMLEK